MNFLVDLVCCDTCLDKGMSIVKCLTGQYCYFSKDCDILWCFYFNLFLELWLLLLFGNWCEIVVWFYDLLWDWSLGRYDSRSQWSAKLEWWIFLFCLLLFWDMAHFMDRPWRLETVLIAEERIFEIHLFADRALHTGLLAASRCPAFCVYFHVD